MLKIKCQRNFVVHFLMKILYLFICCLTNVESSWPFPACLLDHLTTTKVECKQHHYLYNKIIQQNKKVGSSLPACLIKINMDVSH